MHWLAQRILKHKNLVLISFLALTVLSVFLAKGVKVNYQLMDYLPEDSPSTVALDVMNEAFAKAPPNLRVMIKDVDVPAALEYKQRISELDGVLEITWLDDAVNIHQPLETMDEKTLHSWYKDRNALFVVSVHSEKIEKTVGEIRNLSGAQGVLAGDAANISATQETTGKEVSAIMMFLIPIILFILLVTTSSWFEPVLFLLAIGIAILINNGTNILLGEISFITMATSSILQLAVSMDYSIFLLHRFAEYRAEGLAVKNAMVKAMEKAFSPILASGLTTIIGFTALLFMRFKLGPDMGIVLAKGICFSLLSVIFLLPVLTVFTYKIIDKTRHRSFLPSFQGFGKVVSRLFLPVLIMVAAVIVPSYLAQQHNTFIYGSSAMSSDETSQAWKEEHEIDTLFGKANQMVLLVPSHKIVTEKELIDDLHRLPEISSIVSYAESVGTTIPQEFIPGSSLEQLVSKGYSRIILTVNTAQESEAAFQAVEKIRSTAQRHYNDSYYFTGGSVNVYDMKQTVTTDNQTVTFVSILGIGLIIFLTFRSLSIPLILLLTIETSIWLNLAVPYFTGSSMAYIGFMIISSVQLGATVDYAILFANRYIENRENLEKRAAIIRTVSDTTASILTSAGILTTAGFVLGIISTNGVVGEFGILIGRGAALSAGMVLFFLPALLYFSDSVLPKTTWGLHFYHPERKA